MGRKSSQSIRQDTGGQWLHQPSLVFGSHFAVLQPVGDVACFSFHPRKLLTTREGGMLTTARADLDQRFRLLRQHGMTVSDLSRHESSKPVFESYSEIGYNYKMTDVQAAIGREQLKKLPAMVARRRELVDRYRLLLVDIPGLRLPDEPAWSRSNWQSFCVTLPEGVGQEAVMQALLDAGVSSRRGIMCAHREPAYTNQPWSCGSGPGACACGPEGCARLRRSEEAQDRCLILPLFHQLTEPDQDRVAAACGPAGATPAARR